MGLYRVSRNSNSLISHDSGLCALRTRPLLLYVPRVCKVQEIRRYGQKVEAQILIRYTKIASFPKELLDKYYSP